MGAVTVRVVPRSGRPGVEAGPGGVVIRVQAAPAEGRATEEARRALARALGLPRSRVTLRSGARSRTKVLDVAGVTGEEVLERLRRV